jgi:hypothetical protein
VVGSRRRRGEHIEGSNPLRRQLAQALFPSFVVDPLSDPEPVVGDERVWHAKVAVRFVVGAGGGMPSPPVIFKRRPDHVERI